MRAYLANDVPVYTGKVPYIANDEYIYICMYAVRLPVQENKSRQISPELTTYNTSVLYIYLSVRTTRLSIYTYTRTIRGMRWNVRN